MNTTRTNDRRRSGFTLIELLAVIAIIGVLSGIIMGIARVAQRKSADADARADLQEIAASLEEYRMVVGEYPPDLNTLLASMDIEPQFKEFDLVDRWNNPYVYQRLTGNLTYELESYGQDGLNHESNPTINADDDIDLGSNAY